MRSLCIGFLFLSGLVSAQQQIEIRDEIEEVNFMPYEISVFADSSNALTFQDIVQNSSRFKVNTTYQNKDFLAEINYWIRIPVKGNPQSKKLWLFEFYDQTIDQIDAYMPESSGQYSVIHLGDEARFPLRDIHHKNFEVQLDLKSDKVYYYYFRVRSHDFADLRIALRSVNRFVSYALSEYFLFGMFYGMILIISLYNFLVYLAIREIKNIYYIIYILSVGAYALALDGIGFQYLWPSYPDWNAYATGICLYSVIISALVFTRRFLSTRSNTPWLDKVLKAAIGLRTAVFVIELIFFPEWLSYRNFDIVPLSLVFYTGILVWIRGYRPARFFVIAYGVLFLGFFIRTLVYLNFLPFTTLSHYSLHLSFALEMLLLTFALSDRIRIIKAIRDRALRRMIQEHEQNIQLKEKVNKELERLVLDRTSEINEKNQLLQETNDKLNRQAHEINQINSILDLDNWKLKNSIKEVLSDRLHDKTMDYAQFQTLYQDDLACYRFLESLKWEHGYRCRKCDNDKYFKGAQKFARRCTRCGYNESITAFTVFHSIKFPIEKAFYISYLTVAGKKDYTLEQLATTLDLSLNTVWAFRQKVTDRMESGKRDGFKSAGSGWEEIILDTEKVTS